MYKIESPPSLKADINDLADFVEVECIRTGIISKREIIATLQRSDEVDLSHGHQIDDPLDNQIDDVFIEIERRKKICTGSYPFNVDDKGFIVRFDRNIDSIFLNLYCFLLFATRLNMKKKKVQNGIDGTLLFEEISLVIAKEYLGPRSRAFLFGTSSDEGNFKSKIGKLCNELGEGRGFSTRNLEAAKYKKDDTLDIVVWKPFSDTLPGKLILFGQCKTGTHWEDTLQQLQPSSFIHSWFIDSLAVEPVKMFFITDSLKVSEWHHFSTKGGIIFDRLRIMDYATTFEQRLLEKIQKWTNPFLAHLN